MAKYPVLPANPNNPVEFENTPYVVANESNNSFYRYLMPKDGDCGYHSLGISRAEVVKKLLEHFNDVSIRDMIGCEIEAALHADDLPFSIQNLECGEDLEELKNQFVNANSSLDNCVSNLKKNLSIKYPLSNKLNAEELKQFIEDVLKINVDDKSLTLHNSLLEFYMDKVDIIKEKISSRCREADIFKAYIEHYIALPGKFLTFFPETKPNIMMQSSLDAIAKLYNLNVTVWGKGHNNQIQVLYRTKSIASANTINMLFENNHFDLLRNEPSLSIKPVSTYFWTRDYLKEEMERNKELQKLSEQLKKLNAKISSAPKPDRIELNKKTQDKNINDGFLTSILKKNFNEKPCFKIEIKKIKNKEGSEKIQVKVYQHTDVTGNCPTKIFEDRIECINGQIKPKLYAGFNNFNFKIDTNGTLEILELEDCNLLLSCTQDIHFTKPVQNTGWIAIDCKGKVNNTSVLEFNAGFYCKASQLNNQGVIQGAEAVIEKQLGKNDALTLNNTKGKLIINGMLRIKSGELNNAQGKIISRFSRIIAKGEINNRSGYINTLGYNYLLCKDQLKNQHGSITSDAGTISILATEGKVICTDNGKIQAGKVTEEQGIVSINANQIITDESSLIRGGEQTIIHAKDKLRQETILASKFISIQSDKTIDLNGGIHAKDYAQINSNKKNLTLNKKVYGKVISLDAWSLYLNSQLQGQKAKLNLCVHLVHKRDTFQISKLLSISSYLSPRIYEPFNLQGSLHFDIYGKLGTINIHAPITLGNKNKVSHFTVHAPDLSMNIGTKYGNFIEVSASGNVNVEKIKSFNVINGHVLGGTGISVDSSTNAIVGSLEYPDSQRRCGLLSGGDLKLKAEDEILLHKSSAIAQRDLDFKSKKLIDAQVSDIEVSNNATLDAPQSYLRLQTRKWDRSANRTHYLAGCFLNFKINQGGLYLPSCEGVEAVSGPASMNVTKKLTLKGECEVLGSNIHYGSLEGNTPQFKTFIPYYKFEIAQQYLKVPGQQYINEGLRQVAVSSGSESTLALSKIDLTGTFVTTQANVTVDNDIAGYVINVALPSPKDFTQDLLLSNFLPKSSAYVFTNDLNASTVMKSLLPKQINIPLPPVTVLQPDGHLTDNTEQLPQMMTDDMNAKAIVSAFMQELKRGFLDEINNTPELMLYQLMENAQKLLHEQDNSQSLVTPQISSLDAWKKTITVPVLVFVKTNFEDRNVLSPQVVLPLSWDNIRLRDHAGALYALFDINMKGKSQEHSTLLVTCHLEAGRYLTIENLNEFELQKRMYESTKQGSVTTETRNLIGHKKRKTEHFDVKIYTEEAGGTANARGIRVKNVNKMKMKGSELNAGQDGILIDTKKLGEQANITTNTTQHSASDKNLIKKEKRIETLINSTINPTKMNSIGPITVNTEEMEAHSLEATAMDDVSLNAKRMELGTTTVSQQKPTEINASRSKIHVTTGTYEKGSVVQITSLNGQVNCTSDSMRLIGTQVKGKKGVNYFARYRLVQEPLHLKETRQTKTSGIHGLKLIKIKQKQNHESGICPTTISDENIKIEVQEGDALLIAPVLLASSTIDLLTPQGTTTIKPATFHHDVTTTQYSMGVSFFGSSYVEAMMRGDFEKAAANIAREFPIVKHIDDWASHSKDTADKMGNATHSLISIYKTYKAFAGASNIYEFMQGQMNGNIQVRFGKDKEVQSWEQLALPWMQARAINMVAKNINSTGLQAECEKFCAKAEEHASFQAAKANNSYQKTSTGIAPGYDCLKNVPNLSADLSVINKKAHEYIHSHINASKTFELIAGDKISLKGLFVDTAHAILEAHQCTIETLQDLSKSTEYGGSVSTLGNVSVSGGVSERKVASEQSGINATHTLLLKIKDELQLIGSILKVGNEAKANKGKTQDGEELSLYEFELPNSMSIINILNIAPSDIQKSILKPRTLLALQECFIHHLLNNTLPKSLETEHTKRWKKVLEDTPCDESTQKEIANYLKQSNNASQVLLKLIPHLRVSSDQNANDTDWVLFSFLSELSPCDMRFWEKTNPEQLLSIAVLTSSNPNKTEITDICYDPKKKQWTLLNKEPGLVIADKITGKDVTDKETSTKASVGLDLGSLFGSGLAGGDSCPIKGVGDADYHGKHYERINYATASPNIAMRSNNISGVSRDINKSRKVTADKNHHVRGVVPIVNPKTGAQDVYKTVTTKPKMFQKPVNDEVDKNPSDKSEQNKRKEQERIKKEKEKLIREKKRRINQEKINKERKKISQKMRETMVETLTEATQQELIDNQIKLSKEEIQKAVKEQTSNIRNKDLIRHLKYGSIGSNPELLKQQLGNILLGILGISNAHASVPNESITNNNKESNKQSAVERRDALNRELYGEHHLADSSEATIVVGGVYENAKDTVIAAGQLAKGAGIAALSTGGLGLVPENVKNQAQKDVGDFWSGLKNAAVNYEQTGAAVKKSLADRMDNCGKEYENGNYFKAGQAIGPVAGSLNPASALGAAKTLLKVENIGVKGATNFYKLSNITTKTLENGARKIIKQGAKIPDKIRKTVHDITGPQGLTPAFAGVPAAGVGVGKASAGAEKPLLNMFRKKHENNAILNNNGLIKNNIKNKKKDTGYPHKSVNELEFQTPKENTEFHITLKNAQNGAGIPRASSVSDALRLKVELAFKEAGFLDLNGNLSSDAINSSRILIKGPKLKNINLINDLTKNGSNLKDWGKYTTISLKLNTGQNVQIHFYYNTLTKELNKTWDYKIKEVILPFKDISPKI